MKNLIRSFNFYPLGSPWKRYSRIGLLCLVTLTGIFCQAQTKGDNTIIVHNVSFKEAVNNLLDQGYAIDKIDKDFETATTYVKGNTVISIRIKDSSLYITGAMTSMAYRFNIYYNKSNKRWDDLMDYASSFKNEITYAAGR